jgi:hypothetical protein
LRNAIDPQKIKLTAERIEQIYSDIHSQIEAGEELSWFDRVHINEEKFKKKLW